jgi:glycosyltransferase involved in cell wall biosynthesis
MFPTILQVLPALNAGGVERGTLEIAAAITEAGGRALVASAGGRLVPALEALGGEHFTLPLASKAAIWGNAGRLAALARAEGVDIIHARSRAPAWSAWRAARLTALPLVTTWHGTYNENFPGKALYNSVMARGARVIAISDFIRAHVLARHPEVLPRLRSIYRGVDPALFDPDTIAPARVAALREAWGLRPGQPALLLPARLTRWKGQAVLIAALARLPNPPMAVLLGDGRPGYAAELTSLAAARGVPLVLAGHTADMPAALLACDIIIHASTEAEAFGRVVIEAQAMRRPVIAADLGGPRETITHGRTGWLAPPGDAAALARTLAMVLAMAPEARDAIGAAARADVLARFTTAAMQAATLDVYRELT